MESSILLVQNILNCLSGIGFYKIPYTDEALENFFKTHTLWRLFETLFWSKKHEQIEKMENGCLYEFYNVSGSSYFCYYHRADNCLLLLGPVLTQPVSPTELRARLRKYSFTGTQAEQLLEHNNQLPTLAFDVLYRLAVLLIQHVAQTDTPVSYQKIEFSPAGAFVEQMILEEAEEMTQMRRVENRYEISNALTEAVKQGNFSLAIQFLSEFRTGRAAALESRNQNPLRNRQNYCIILNTQLRYALENSGIHPYRLDRFSNEAALNIERLKSIDEVDRFVYHTIRGYCELVQEHAYPKLKLLTQLTVAYIKSHLEDTITVKDTAKELVVNPDYLSAQFHSDMGVSFIDFLNRERVCQAASLLRQTDWQIERIATTVGYNNTSYFAKQFKRVFHQTPKEYRKNAVL